MKNKELFDSTVRILTDAYRNDTLQHANCHACAVGNMVAACNGYAFAEGGQKVWQDHIPAWNYAFVTDSETAKQVKHLERVDPTNPYYIAMTAEQIKSTGYPAEDLARIEYAFECADQGDSVDEYMFNGLLAVYDVLCDIHEVDREEVKKGEEVFV